MSTPTSSNAEGLDQLSTTTSRPSTPSAEKQDSSAEAGKMDGKVLRVPHASPQQAWRLHRTLTPIHGSCPSDEPLEQDTTWTMLDRRMLQPLTVRYRTLERERHLFHDCHLQDRLTRAVWRQLQMLLGSRWEEKHRPAVLFEWQLDAEGRPWSCIDFTFAHDSMEAFLALRDKIERVEVEDEKAQAVTFGQYCWSTTLSGDILPLDIIGLPPQEVRLESFFAAMQDVVASVGETVGAGIISVGERPDKARAANITRVYVKLTRQSMELSHSDLIGGLPTLLDWKGSVVSVRYSGRNLHKVQKHSKRYPGEQASESST